MALLKKTPFRVPSLAEIDKDYAALVARRDDLLGRQAELRSRRAELEERISKMPEPAVRASVAQLLGDTPDSKSGLRQELSALVAEARDIDAALEVLRQRIAAARGKASVAVCAAVKGEYRARVAGVAEALRAVATAREHLHQLPDALEAEDVAWGPRGPVSLGFRGDRRDGHVERFLRENAHA